MGLKQLIRTVLLMTERDADDEPDPDAGRRVSRRMARMRDARTRGIILQVAEEECNLPAHLRVDVPGAV